MARPNLPQFEVDYDFYKMRVLVDELNRWVDSVESGESGAGGATGEHNLLTGRSDADCHPISAITDLSGTLAAQAALISANSAAIVVNAGDIATNTANISTNAAGIAANVISIADHEVRITALEAIVPQDFQDVYDAETTPAQIVLTSALGGFVIQDNAVPIAASLFRVEDTASTGIFDVDASRVQAGEDILPRVDADRFTQLSGMVAVGTEAYKIHGFRGRTGIFGTTEYPTGSGYTGSITLYGGYDSQGGLMAGSAFGAGTATLRMGAGPYPTVGLLGNAFAGGASATSTIDHRSGAGTVFGSVFSFAVTGTASIYTGRYVYGNFTGGYCVARGSGTSDITMQASGAFNWTYVDTTNGGPNTVYVSGPGSFTVGLIDGNQASAVKTMTNSGQGAFLQGIMRGNNAGSMTASGQGAFLQGRETAGGVMLCSGNGAFLQGSCASTGGGMYSTNVGSFAQGAKSQASYLQATASGAFVQGRVRDAGSYLSSTGIGAFCQGYVQNGYTMVASGRGAFAHGSCENADITAGVAVAAFAAGYTSTYAITASGTAAFAFGNADVAAIIASASNSVQWGPGTNALADSMQVGTGFLSTASGAHRGVRETVTLGAAATTFAIGSQSIEVTGDAGANVIATITGALAGQFLALQFVDALVTITDDNTHAADSVDLSAAFVSADDTMLFLWYDGTSWYEVSRSVN